MRRRMMVKRRMMVRKRKMAERKRKAVMMKRKARKNDEPAVSNLYFYENKCKR
jgi:hypothetical protein